MIRIYSLLVLSVFMVTACGVKPGELSPPTGSKDVKFPRTYPDPATDPK